MNNPERKTILLRAAYDLLTKLDNGHPIAMGHVRNRNMSSSLFARLAISSGRLRDGRDARRKAYWEEKAKS
jgi:hypothetical protein